MAENTTVSEGRAEHPSPTARGPCRIAPECQNLDTWPRSSLSKKINLILHHKPLTMDERKGIVLSGWRVN
jgi:hypothetical protein